MSKDRMQDVMPLSFDFKKGEMPSDQKLTKWAQLTDIALDRVTQAVGDPWDYQLHSTISQVRFYLSIENLAQVNLARFSGPSSLVSPGGNTLGQTMASDIAVTLEAKRNSWSIGFPLCRSNTTGSIIGPKSNDSNLTESILDNINFVDKATLNPIAQFGTPASTYRKSNATDILAEGDYFIDWRTGTVTTYTVPTADVTMNIPQSADVQFFGSGAPWTTHNVIPDWEEGSNAGVIIEYMSDGGGVYNYTITMPSVNAVPRVGSGSSIPGSPEVTVAPGAATGSQYRLPYVLNELGGGETIPEGFVFLLDNTTGSIVPLTTFSTGTIPDHLTTMVVTCPQLPGVTTGPNSSRYRIVTAGSSLAETVGYLAAVVRNNSHTGISERTDGAIADTLAFTPSIKHSSLSERYNIVGDVPSSDNSYSDKLSFVESKYPTNDHPQYLHRGGFMEEESSANSKNAMRGDLVFSAKDTFKTSDDINGGVGTSTYGVFFGGNDTSGDSRTPSIHFNGGVNLTPSASGHSTRLGFGLKGVGLLSHDSDLVNDNNKYGALEVTQFYGMPLYLKGNTDVGTNSRDYETGGTLGFDLGDDNEMNYIQLVGPSRLSEASDSFNIPADTGTSYFSLPLDITNGLSNRVSYLQSREFRFRACSYVETATNTSDSIGGLNDEVEFNKYFTSPSIVGADWLNVYSNAIFFSDTGDGRSTSFTKNGKEWLEADSYDPIGMYYIPQKVNIEAGNHGSYEFVTEGYIAGAIPRYSALSLSFHGQSILRGFGGIKLETSSYVTIGATSSSYDETSVYIQAGMLAEDYNANWVTEGTVAIVSDTKTNMYANDSTYIGANNTILIYPGSGLYLGHDSGTSHVRIQAGKTASGNSYGEIGIAASEYIKLASDKDIEIAGNEVSIIAGSGDLHLDVSESVSCDVRLEGILNYEMVYDGGVSYQWDLISTNASGRVRASKLYFYDPLDVPSSDSARLDALEKWLSKFTERFSNEGDNHFLLELLP